MQTPGCLRPPAQTHLFTRLPGTPSGLRPHHVLPLAPPSVLQNYHILSSCLEFGLPVFPPALRVGGELKSMKYGGAGAQP